MSLDTINRVNREVAAKAAQENLLPYVPFNSDEVDDWPTFPFPNFGENYIPEGWQKEGKWFVDSSETGSEDEPALTVKRFKKELRIYIAKHPGHGFAIIGEGQFQVYIGAFQRDSF